MCNSEFQVSKMQDVSKEAQHWLPNYAAWMAVRMTSSQRQTIAVCCILMVTCQITADYSDFSRQRFILLNEYFLKVFKNYAVHKNSRWRNGVSAIRFVSHCNLLWVWLNQSSRLPSIVFTSAILLFWNGIVGLAKDVCIAKFLTLERVMLIRGYPALESEGENGN